jgi:hypothetical protein
VLQETTKRLGKNQHKCLPISRSNKNKKNSTKLKRFSRNKLFKEEVGGGSHHI